MKLWATDAPMDTAPAPIPMPTATDTPTTVAMIEEEFCESSDTFPEPPVVITLLASMNVFGFVRITLVDSAPAPLRPMPAKRPPPTLTEAATERAVIEPSRVQRAVLE